MPLLIFVVVVWFWFYETGSVCTALAVLDWFFYIYLKTTKTGLLILHGHFCNSEEFSLSSLQIISYTGPFKSMAPLFIVITCIYVYTYIDIQIYISVYIQICMCMCIYICMYTHIFKSNLLNFMLLVFFFQGWPFGIRQPICVLLPGIDCFSLSQHSIVA